MGQQLPTGLQPRRAKRTWVIRTWQTLLSGWTLLFAFTAVGQADLFEPARCVSAEMVTRCIGLRCSRHGAREHAAGRRSRGL